METTLVAFMYLDHRAHSVELLGSWDNFSKAYPMTRDTRRGGGQWTGCYRFEDITLDGDKSPTGGMRDGGLKMGSTYWYYYRVDGTDEAYDEAEPHTTACPLLPGQCVNVLDVPSDGSLELQLSRTTSSSSAIQTLDPHDRYVNPRPAPKPRVNSPVSPSSKTADTSKVKARLFNGYLYPTTADGRLTEPELPAFLTADERQVRSAEESSITSSTKSAFSLLKSPRLGLSPRSPSKHRRGRSRTLRKERRTQEQSPSPVREMEIGAPTLTSRSDPYRWQVSLQEAQNALRGAPAQAAAPSWEHAPLQSHPITEDDRHTRAYRNSKSDHRRVSSDTLVGSAMDVHPALRRSRSLANVRLDSPRYPPPSPGDFEPFYSQRAASRRRRREGLALRTSFGHDELQKIQCFNPPTLIRESDLEYAQSPRSADCTPASPFSAQVHFAEVAVFQRYQPIQTAAVGKDFPDELMPQPLRIRTAPAELPATAPTPVNEVFVPKRSHFSMWSNSSANAGAHDEVEVKLDVDGAAMMMESPLFSSVEGGSSTGESSPLRLLPELEAMCIIDDYFGLQDDDAVAAAAIAQEEAGVHDAGSAPHLEALQELRDIVRGARSSSTSTPFAVQRPFTSPLLARSRDLLGTADMATSTASTPTPSMKMPLPLHSSNGGEPIVAVAGESLPEQVAASRHLTQMDGLAEFDYLGGVLS